MSDDLSGRSSAALSAARRQARVAVLLSVQRALLDEVTPQLRGVLLTWDARPDEVEPFSIAADFYYETEVDDDAVQHVSEVEGYVAADFGAGLDIRFTPLHLPSERPLPRLLQADLDAKDWAYRRFENDGAAPH